MTFLLIWLACGVIGAVIAQSNDRPPLLGGLIGITAGPLGVLIVAVMGKLEPGKSELGVSRPIKIIATSALALVAGVLVLAMIVPSS